MFTVDELRLILDRVGLEEVATFDGYKVVKQGRGYSEDETIGKLQAKLSIMLQVASQMKAKGN